MVVPALPRTSFGRTTNFSFMPFVPCSASLACPFSRAPLRCRVAFSHVSCIGSVGVSLRLIAACFILLNVSRVYLASTGGRESMAEFIGNAGIISECMGEGGLTPGRRNIHIYISPIAITIRAAFVCSKEQSCIDDARKAFSRAFAISSFAFESQALLGCLQLTSRGPQQGKV